MISKQIGEFKSILRCGENVNMIDKRTVYYNVMKKNNVKKKDLSNPIERLIEFGNTVVSIKSYKKVRKEMNELFPNLIVKTPFNEKSAQYLILEIGKGE